MRGYSRTLPMAARALAFCVCVICAPGFPEGAPPPRPPQTTSRAPPEALPPEAPKAQAIATTPHIEYPEDLIEPLEYL